MMKRGKAGINPVIATVILVAVAIVIAIAVAFWASGLVGAFTRFEKLEIISSVMKSQTEFEVRIRNTGSTATSLIQVVINGQFVADVTGTTTLESGETRICGVTVSTSPPAGV
ncbi:MAG TPA: hypothetical protein EYH45_01120, partial [Candidatus Caldiarchaeum subterraneum]|nr:hypothetical protein [Candidatus Caldarchaeum subterraneum]